MSEPLTFNTQFENLSSLA